MSIASSVFGCYPTALQDGFSKLEFKIVIWHIWALDEDRPFNRNKCGTCDTISENPCHDGGRCVASASSRTVCSLVCEIQKTEKPRPLFSSRADRPLSRHNVQPTQPTQKNSPWINRHVASFVLEHLHRLIKARLFPRRPIFNHA